MTKTIEKYAKAYKQGLIWKGFSDIEGKTILYKNKLEEMYVSQAYEKHNIYPTINTEKVYAVIAMCLQLKEYGMDDSEILDFLNFSFRKARKLFDRLSAIINILPNSYQIAKKWNISDHDKRIADKSVTYDYFIATDEKIEYKVSKCMYVEMFDYYGIRGLCKIFCQSDERIYANLPRHVKYIRHSELATGDTCHDEIIKK
ncbi:MAG: L-2-amino-thiazoline-4-carboxylic acid hydrolase [Faecalibacterium sp.]|nr:L-2-amino-thiazoline-4-carboxylic acid hydrolase [Ruminococcus sp.]MCM1392284.1 L-2-amino-thiazoline-4-carboxylic acid hydrolase [Ruminococcus sp.]MCM1486553.1 L-2-amino-thiazoline-4-carboxylic acid hydrolase [Faecalibacterium sp.]